MKKILIINNNLHIGGVQKALVSLLWNICGDYEITLLLFSKTGAYMKDIPPAVRVITPGSHFRYLGLTRMDTLTPMDKLLRSFYAGMTRLFGRETAVSLMGLGQKRLGGFDMAISFLHNSHDRSFYGGCNEFVLNHVDAERKIAFLHCDFQQCGADTPKNRAQYARFDRIAACSQGCADAFLRANPGMEGKVTVVPNCHRFDRLRQMPAEAPVSMASDRVNLVTVSRFGKEKGVERALRVIARLGSFREKLHYYIIGDGIQKPEILRILAEEKLEKTVTLCGMMENPYGYVAAADLLLIPSYSEAAPLVIGESASLGTPVLSMETSSAREMIEKTGFGWVCENSEDAMLAALQALLAEPGHLAQAKLRLSAMQFGNETALAQFRAL